MNTSDENEDKPTSANLVDYVEIHPGMKWGCVMCGSCCGNVFSTSWLDLHVADQVGDVVDGYCPHLDRENGNRCLIYDSRPNICRGYPFVIKKNGDHYILTIHEKCIGIGNGGELDIEGKLMELMKLVEEDHGIEFMINKLEGNDFNLYKMK